MTDKTNNIKDSSPFYRVPEVSMILMNGQDVLCQSGDTEDYIIGGSNFDDDDWV